MVVAHGTFPTIQWFPEKEIRASLVLQQTTTDIVTETIPDGTLLGTEYQALLHNNDVPLWKILGLEVRTIMIDPGHGGTDSGAIGQLGTLEKNLVLDIAKRLQKRLLSHGRYRVVITRKDDTFLSLNERVALAKEEEADIFVSIHLNYLPKKPINIIETFYFGPSEDAKTAKLAMRENAGSQFGLNHFKVMVKKLSDSLKLKESKELARSLQSNLFSRSSEADGSILDYGIKRAPFVVLLGADVPAVLVEVSCLSNVAEERNLNTVEHREDIAQYLETGILDYRSKGETQYVSGR